jgi:hypothetical protein
MNVVWGGAVPGGSQRVASRDTAAMATRAMGTGCLEVTRLVYS